MWVISHGVTIQMKLIRLTKKAYARVVFTDSKKIYLLQYTEQYQRKVQSTPDNSNLQKNYKENYKQMKIASS